MTTTQTPEGFEEHIKTTAWFQVLSAAKDDDDDGASVYRMARMAAQEAWTAALSSSARDQEGVRDEDLSAFAQAARESTAECQYAKDVDMWPEHRCAVKCQYGQAKSAAPVEPAGWRRKAACDALLQAAHDFWDSERQAGQQGAVKWVQADDGSLVIFTRGEYRDELMKAISGPSDATHRFATPPAAIPEAHTDDAAVDRFAAALKAKLAKQREKGYEGWETCPPERLQEMLFNHIPKGDPVDVGNFAMFLFARGERTAYEDQWVFDMTGKWPTTLSPMHVSEAPAQPKFSCYLERDFGKAPCDHDCGKLRCMYPTTPEAPAQTEADLLFDFGGFLTSHKRRWVFSSADDAAHMVEAIREFAARRGIDLDATPPEPAHSPAPVQTHAGASDLGDDTKGDAA